MENNKIIDGMQHAITAIVFKENKILMFDRRGED